MNCDRVRRALDALVDGELRPWTAWQVRRHLARCPACTGELESARRLTEQAREWRDAALPASLQARVTDALTMARSSMPAEGAEGRSVRRKESVWMMTARWGWIAMAAAVLAALWVGNQRGGDALAATLRATEAAPAIHMVARGSQGTYGEAWFVAQVGSYVHTKPPGKELIEVDDLKHRFHYQVDARHVEIMPSELAKGRSPLEEIPTGAQALKKLQARQGSKNVTVKTIVRNGRRLRQISAAGDPEVFTIDPETDRLVLIETGGLPGTAAERIRFELDYPDPATVDRALFRFQIPAGATVSTQSESSLACMSRMKQLAMGFRMYSLDYDDHLPPMKTAAQVAGPLSPYVMPALRPNLFVCPVTRAPYQPNAALSGKLYPKAGNNTLLFWDSKPHPDGLWTVCYLDGRVDRQKKAPGR